jgi:hypothetical protein
MRREGHVDVVAVRIVEAGADDGGFQIVMPNHARHAAEVTKARSWSRRNVSSF